MTWTVFEHNAGSNPTGDAAPGRGGYTYVVAHAPKDVAAELFEDVYGEDPRDAYTVGGDGPPRKKWLEHEVDTEREARELCGEIDVMGGGVGVPKTRARTMEELHSSLDVLVWQEQAMVEAANECDAQLPPEASERAHKETKDNESSALGKSDETPSEASERAHKETKDNESSALGKSDETPSDGGEGQ